MSLEEVLSPYRARYVQFYRDRIAHVRAEHADCVPEVMVQPNGAVNPAPFSLLRLDAVYGGAAKPTAIRFVMDPKPPAFSKATFRGTSLALQSITWEDLRISFSAPTFRMESLRAWLSAWIDEFDSKPPDEVGLSAVVHSIAWDSSPTGAWSSTADFGSAPIEAVIELLDIVLSHEPENVVLGHSS